MPFFHPKTLLDKTYELGLIIKGIDGTFELLGGIAVLTLSPSAVHRVANFLTHGDTDGAIGQHIDKLANSLAAGHTLYAAVFLLSHGIIKIALVACLLLNKLWAYPWALLALAGFLIFQVYAFIQHPGFGMGFLSVLDAFIIWLVYREWQIVQRERGQHKPPVTDEAA